MKYWPKVYWSDVGNETWDDSSDVMTYVFIPKKWWSLKQWKIAREFQKELQLYFMKKS